MLTCFAPDLLPGQPTYTLSEDESKHAVRVLRLPPGAPVTLVDGRGTIFAATVADANPKRCSLYVVNQEVIAPRATYLHVAVAPTKNLDRMEWLVEKAVEVGVERLSFLRCAHSERRELKLERLEKIAISALKQSGQAYLPQLDEMLDFEAFIEEIDASATFIAHLEAGERLPLARALASTARACVLIGPEGDFSPAEIALALGRGVRPVTLGDSRLRTETAALAAVFTAQVVGQLPA
ncbi:16S rRNA (uracil(1498)-N(3))-methyltransferase [Hymenobacter psoromatis]|nr:16S rRNA (uracil(1498)-N(3))-methyltransferase [Hymenobacter psoromatis]